jgi:hypothetical protein
MNLNIKTATWYFSLIFISILVVYYAPTIIVFLWFILLLVLYWRSQDEPFWFAIFFVLSDGFMGFFGAYQATLPLLPGLPPIEIGQFYILLTVLKAYNRPKVFPLFFHKYLSLMGIYVLFLILVGILFGIKSTPNDYFRVVKLTLPLLLFYSIPKLMFHVRDFTRVFSLLFPIAILAFITQLFDIITGQSFSGLFGAKNIPYWDVMEGRIYRVFYNVNIILMSFFGSLYFSSRKNNPFNIFYLYSVVLASVSVAFLSATRGWIIAFAVTLALYVLIMSRIKITRLAIFTIIGVAIFTIGYRNPFIQSQVKRSFERFRTMETVAEGDLTAGGTVTRATEQSQDVLNKWKESPVFGWGFSEEYRKYINEHVGNQNILLHSGIIGLLLMFSFFLYFHFRLINAGRIFNRREYFIFLIFFAGWFIIHSTSGQHFAYYQMPKNIMAQSFYFSFGALLYWDAITGRYA